MKNLIWILAAIMLAGCGDNEEGQDMGLHGDPPGYSLFIWSNESDHRITMTVTDRFEKKEILPGESLLQEEVGFVTPPSLEGYMIDGVSIVFDDGPYGGVFFRTDKVTAFNPCLELYGGTVEYRWLYWILQVDLYLHQRRLRCGRGSRADEGAVTIRERLVCRHETRPGNISRPGFCRKLCRSRLHSRKISLHL